MTNHIERLVLNFPGFETTGSVHQIERLTAGGLKTAKLWGFNMEPDSINENAINHKTSTIFTSSGEGWTAKTRYVHFSWADIIAKYENRPYPLSLILHLPKYLTFFLDGSVNKYAKASRRYWGFTIYPLLLMTLFAAISIGICYWLMVSLVPHWIFLVPIALTIFLVLCRWPGDYLYVNLSVNDWAFARDMCNSTNREIDERYEQFANHLIDEVAHAEPDEILIVGHSFGSVWAVMALALALEKRPELLSGKRVTFLALGSSLLKIGLVARAKFFKSAVVKVLSQVDLLWHEIQTKTDFISFYKSDPFEPMKIANTACDVIVHRVNFKKALSDKRHAKMKKSMYLAHRQYILYCDKRVHHDFQLRVFGPYSADELARDTDLALTNSLTNTKDASQ